MIDVDIIAATVEPSIPVDHLPPRSRNPDPDDLDRRATSRNGLTMFCCEPGVNEIGDHTAIEPMGEHKQIIGDAVWIAGEHF